MACVSSLVCQETLKTSRGVVLDSVERERMKGSSARRDSCGTIHLETEDCISIRELLGNCLSKKDRLREVGKKVFILASSELAG